MEILFPFPYFYSHSHSHDIVVVTLIPMEFPWDPWDSQLFPFPCTSLVSMTRGYAYAKIEYVSVRTYLSKNRIHVSVLSGRGNVQGNMSERGMSYNPTDR